MAGIVSERKRKVLAALHRLSEQADAEMERKRKPLPANMDEVVAKHLQAMAAKKAQEKI